MFDNLGLISLLQKGGVTVIVLAFFSVLSVGVMMERLWALFKFRRGSKIFSLQIEKALRDGNREAAFTICGKEEPLARIFKAGLTKYKEGKTAVGEAMELAAKQELLYLERYLGVLGTTGSTAPFVGLFGTVLGIIRAFHDLAIAEGAGPSVVADGIAEALVATAAGLFVAVPAVIAYNYFTRKINSAAVEIEGRAAEFIDALFEDNK
ncbi:MAG: hypothetical protein A3G39_09055 [Deltaproteobacteria bacterium RIFCSPLOWO2_12_FULL_43_16]|nr:MAG: hypothetical protein A2Z89_08330 [Deltaproteobacteria bacterium GWA2_43_19]OGQ09098.1 MAG: hypothetical protein A3D30_08655 [Deltaproteobacteria bacterium RIFCSPHIGHO2_02_FULL_43_33]OGQ57645.1 MAG: hypothetical protein A3G39_09055 [Deltaproteobacteria bacterium RIFCSPLOWO2_12_FULL_43_16]HBR17932.1 hypothetical protein [Deltaproteobacteria bacterium]